MIPYPNEQESHFVKDYIILPFVLTVLDRDKKIIQAAQVKFPRLYLEWMDRVMDAATKDLTEARKGMLKSGINVYEQRRTEKGLDVKYKFKGYHHESSYLWPTLKAFVEKKIEEYLK